MIRAALLVVGLAGCGGGEPGGEVVGALVRGAPIVRAGPRPEPELEVQAKNTPILVINPELEGRVTWEALTGYSVDPENPSIPTEVMAFNGKEITLQGFLTPIRYEGSRMVEFFLGPSHMSCCFGVIPELNGWIVVETCEGCVISGATYTAIRVRGVLIVDEVRDEQGYVYSLYRMKALEIETE